MEKPLGFGAFSFGVCWGERCFLGKTLPTLVPQNLGRRLYLSLVHVPLNPPVAAASRSLAVAQLLAVVLAMDRDWAVGYL